METHRHRTGVGQEEAMKLLIFAILCTMAFDITMGYVIATTWGEGLFPLIMVLIGGFAGGVPCAVVIMDRIKRGANG